YQFEIEAKQQFQTWNLRGAIDTYQQALAIYKRTGNVIGQGNVLIQLSSMYELLDQPEKAISYMNQVLKIADEINASGELLYLRIFPLYGLGNAYSTLGQYEKSIDFYEQALSILQSSQLTNITVLIDAVNLLGEAYFDADRYDKALERYQQALSIAKANRVFEQAENALSNIGRVYEARRQYDQAINHYQQALDINQFQAPYRYNGLSNNDRYYTGFTTAHLTDLGRVHLKLNRPQVAENFLQEALYLRNISRGAGLNDLANITELELGTIIYLLLQKALIKQGKYEAALEIAEQSRTQAFSELIVQNFDFGTDTRADKAGKLESLKKFAREKGSPVVLYAVEKSSPEAVDINGLLFALDVLVILPDGTVELRQNALSDAQFSDFATIARQAFQVLEDSTDTIPNFSFNSIWFDAKLKAKAPHGYNIESRILDELRDQLSRYVYAIITDIVPNPRESDILYVPAINTSKSPNIETIKTISKEQNLTLVEYSIDDTFEPTLSIWVTSPDGRITFHSQSLENVDLNTLIENTQKTMGVRGGLVPTYEAQDSTQANAETDQKLTELYKLLISPIADRLPANPDDPIVMIPKDELFLVPFPALRDETGSYLIEKHTLLTAPSIQILELTHSLAKTTTNESTFQGDSALIVGNPAMPVVSFLNQNGSFQDISLAPLPGAQQEAQAISNFLGASPLIGQRATEASVKQQIADASLIHLATHGLLEYGQLTETGSADIPGAIALTAGNGEDGLLTAQEIQQMDLNAGLVVLSACDTGRGRITGDGVIGLSRSFIAAGAPSVVVSLWSVPDAPTASLMTDFYQQLSQGQTTAQALRQAMLSTMQTHPAPRDWAAFTLIGEN
ncbi:MAG: CHAT domain-containing protein, partial [Leptolyngbya sp. SIO3F4]|nr:CHAT domain-containing protein [Leptolyngbya sp. SIO3F4]